MVATKVLESKTPTRLNPLPMSVHVTPPSELMHALPPLSWRTAISVLPSVQSTAPQSRWVAPDLIAIVPESRIMALEP